MDCPDQSGEDRIQKTVSRPSQNEATGHDQVRADKLQTRRRQSWPIADRGRPEGLPQDMGTPYRTIFEHANDRIFLMDYDRFVEKTPKRWFSAD